MTTISIAMCTYNSEAHLQEQLDSVANQTRLPDELVICDDCSTDRTEDIVRAFVNIAPFKVNFSVNEKRLGSTANFEKAICMCQGDIIALADHDDICYPQ
ncbi:glycosyltransferase [Nitrosomonas sp. Nm58]|uniref:glycosyltransferase n=1 Tax=Nitrosomonas sp. Nm58 TaxID=200126 RepID=UPI000897313E|nr:glycosyltransferase [Nitrosomonas sp. Nm58]SDY91484.1 Glycosyl transferase family 2 [Nitrosomonas sp. Nm58]